LRWRLRPRRGVLITALAGYRRLAISRGDDPELPSVEDLFTDATARGLLVQPDYLHTTITGEIDSRDTAGNTSRGGFYRVAYGRWNDVTLNTYDFTRLDVNAVQFVPLTKGGTHVLSGRIGAVAVNADDGSRVPFYFLPYVGGVDTIRSLREFRYKDQNAVWLSGEYKWRPMAVLSVSAFTDIGQVSADWHSVRAGDMKAGYGVGVSLHSSTQTILRADVATGAGQGWQFFVSLRPRF
jgi:outer membrane protein assembly factor BamA